MSWQTDAASRYGSVAVGLIIGTAARYGVALGEGRRLTWRSVVGDLLLLGLIALIAVIVSDRLGFTGDLKAFVTALLALSSDRVIKLVRKYFESAAEQRLNQLVRASVAGDLAKVPAGNGMPDALRVEVVHDEGYGSALRSRFRKTTQERPPEDQIELLRQLDAD